MSRVRSVERAIAILAALGDGPLGLAGLAARTGLPKSTVSRLLDTLEAVGAVTGGPDGRHALGSRILALATEDGGGVDLVALAHRHLVELSAAVEEAAGLSVPEGFTVRYVDQVSPSHEVQVRDWTGTSAPMHSVSSGQVLLAALGDEEVLALLPDELPALTARTITRREALMVRLAQVRRDGCAWVRDEFAEGISSVAASVRDGSGRAVAAVHVHGPSYRFPPRGREGAIADQVAACAARIATELGAPREGR